MNSHCLKRLRFNKRLIGAKVEQIGDNWCEHVDSAR